jgi:P27 family predicted phage terminase small subunit
LRFRWAKILLGRRKWAMRGGKPKPIQTQIIEGDRSRRGVHKLDERLAALPKAARGLPDAPGRLSAVARDRWAIWKQDLEILEQDYRADAVILEGACVAYARAIEADAILEKNGSEIEEPVLDRVTGELVSVRLKKHPAVARSNSCWRNVKSFCSDLGLSLVARQRLAIQSSGDGLDDLLELLSKPRPRKLGDDIE